MPSLKATYGPPHCLICNSPAYSTIHQFNNWDILQCKNCTLVYVDPVPSIRHLIKTAEDTHSGMGDVQVKNYHRIRNLEDVHDPVIRSCTETLAMIEQSTTGRTLLDIGCGEGTFSAVAKRRGWQVQALDASSTATRTAQFTYNLNVITSVFPCNDLLNGQQFDAIVMQDFLEHVPNPVEAITVARALLRKGGVLYINSPNHRSLLCWVIDTLGKIKLPIIQSLLSSYYQPAHVTVFNPRSLAYLMTTCNLRPLLTGKNLPILDRIELPQILKIFVYVLNKISQLLHLESRVWALARL